MRAVDGSLARHAVRVRAPSRLPQGVCGHVFPGNTSWLPSLFQEALSGSLIKLDRLSADLKASLNPTFGQRSFDLEIRLTQACAHDAFEALCTRLARLKSSGELTTWQAEAGWALPGPLGNS